MGATREQIKLLTKEIPYRWKPQTIKFGKAIMVAYVDARDVQNLFDEAVGPENWQVNYKLVDKQMFASIGVRVQHEDGSSEWIWKEDGGTESNVEQEKGLISDSFKRAAVTWGAGRFLYDLEMMELKTAKDKNGKEQVCTDDGKILYGADKITEYIRKYKIGKPAQPASEPPKYGESNTSPTYSNSTSYSEKTIKRVTSLVIGEKKGKDVLLEYLTKFNEIKKTSYKKISDLGDKEVNELIDYIESNTKKEGI